MIHGSSQACTARSATGQHCHGRTVGDQALSFPPPRRTGGVRSGGRSHKRGSLPYATSTGWAAARAPRRGRAPATPPVRAHPRHGRCPPPLPDTGCPWPGPARPSLPRSGVWWGAAGRPCPARSALPACTADTAAANRHAHPPTRCSRWARRCPSCRCWPGSVDPRSTTPLALGQQPTVSSGTRNTCKPWRSSHAPAVPLAPHSKSSSGCIGQRELDAIAEGLLFPLALNSGLTQVGVDEGY
jgi:hypothetical protein